MEFHSLFAYGSLKQGYLRSNVWPHSPVSIREGVIEARLFDLGPYPAIDLSRESSEGRDWVLGELWTLAPEHIIETLDRLDQVEGYIPEDPRNEYIRRVVSVQIDNVTSIEAYTYEYADRRRFAGCRRMVADRLFNGIRCAAWPDQLARVPKSFDEE